MNIQKKRFATYSIIILLAFSGAFIFLRKKSPQNENVVPENLVKKDSLITVSLFSEFFDLENNGEPFVSTEKASSGKKSCKLSNSNEFGVSLNKSVKNISIKFNAVSGKEDPDALYVLSINDSIGKNIFWDGKPIVLNPSNDWTELNLDFNIPPEFLKPENKIAIYPWNRNKSVFFLDDITIDFIGTAIYQDVPANQSEKSNLFFDFETEAGLSAADNIKETTSHSGTRACDLSGGKEYGPSINKKLSEIGTSFPKKISLSVWVYPLTDNPNVVLTASAVNSKGETVFWDGESTENKSFPKGKWTKINTSYSLPIEKLHPDDVLGVGVWNKGKSDVIVDDLEIVYGEAAERRGLPSKIDPVSIYEKRFTPEKNNAPFKTIYFEKQDIKNDNSNSIAPPIKKNNADEFSPNDKFLVGDFFPDKNNLDEILCIGPARKGLFSYSPEEKQFKKLWGTVLVADSIWNKNNKFYRGDFNSDGKLDILLVDKHNNNWGIINFNGKEWITVSKGKDPKKEWLNKNKSETDFPGNYFGDKQTVLKLNNEWRFDLKLMDGDNILGNIDFKGYPNDFNPKYYEFIKLVPGNFLSKSQTSLLVIMFNCADADFSGERCNNFEELPFLPNSVQLYSIEKQKGFSQIPQIHADTRR